MASASGTDAVETATSSSSSAPATQSLSTASIEASIDPYQSFFKSYLQPGSPQQISNSEAAVATAAAATPEEKQRTNTKTVTFAAGTVSPDSQLTRISGVAFSSAPVVAAGTSAVGAPAPAKALSFREYQELRRQQQQQQQQQVPRITVVDSSDDDDDEEEDSSRTSSRFDLRSGSTEPGESEDESDDEEAANYGSGATFNQTIRAGRFPVGAVRTQTTRPQLLAPAQTAQPAPVIIARIEDIPLPLREQIIITATQDIQKSLEIQLHKIREDSLAQQEAAVRAEEARLKQEFDRKLAETVVQERQIVESQWEQKLKDALQQSAEQQREQIRRELESQVKAELEQHFRTEIQQLQDEKEESLRKMKERYIDQLEQERTNIRQEILHEFAEQQKRAFNAVETLDHDDGLGIAQHDTAFDSHSVQPLLQTPLKSQSYGFQHDNNGVDKEDHNLHEDHGTPQQKHRMNDSLLLQTPPQTVPSSQFKNWQQDFLSNFDNLDPKDIASRVLSAAQETTVNEDHGLFSPFKAKQQAHVPASVPAPIPSREEPVGLSDFQSPGKKKSKVTFGSAKEGQQASPAKSRSVSASRARTPSEDRVRSSAVSVSSSIKPQTRKEVKTTGMYEALLGAATSKSKQSGVRSSTSSSSGATSSSIGQNSQREKIAARLAKINETLEPLTDEISEWQQEESVCTVKFEEQQKLLDKILLPLQENAEFERLLNMLDWLRGMWNSSEISFKHRYEFFESRVVGILIGQDPSRVQVVERAVTEEINSMKKDNSAAEMPSVSKRETLKEKIAEIADLEKANPKKAIKMLQEKNQLIARLKSITNQLATSLDHWEKDHRQEFMYRGLRYLDIITFDKMSQEKNELETEQNEIQRWAKRSVK